MSNTPDNGQSSPSPDEQIGYLNAHLKMVKEILDAPNWSQEVYDTVSNLTVEIRGTMLAIYSNPASTDAHRKRAQSALKESSRLATAANERHRQYAFALQKQQRAR